MNLKSKDSYGVEDEKSTQALHRKDIDLNINSATAI